MPKNAANLGIEFSTQSADETDEEVTGIRESLMGIQDTLKSIKNINAFQAILDGFSLSKLTDIKDTVQNTFTSLKDNVQMSSSLDSEFASARKSAKELANSMGLNNEQMAEMREKSSFAPALNMDMQEVQKTYASLLNRQQDITDLGFDSFKQFSKFIEVNDINGKEYVQTLDKLNKTFGLSKEQISGLQDNVATISQEFGVGGAIMNNFGEITSKVGEKLKAVNGEATPEEIKSYTEQVAEMTGLFKETGQGTEEAKQSAMEFTTSILESRKEMKEMVTGQSGEVPQLFQNIATSQMGFNNAQKAMGERPVEFVQRLGKQYQSLSKSQKNMVNQRVFDQLGSGVREFVTSGNMEAASNKLDNVRKKMNQNAGAAKNMAEMYDTGRTVAEQLAFQEDVFEKNLLDVSKSMGIQNDMLNTVKSSYGTITSNLRTFVDLQGSATNKSGEVTKTISRMGIQLTNTKGNLTAMGSVVQEVSRFFVAFQTGGLFGVLHQLGRLTSSIFGFEDAASMMSSTVRSLANVFRPFSEIVHKVYRTFKNQGTVSALDVAFRSLQGGVKQLREEAFKLVGKVPKLIGQFDQFLSKLHKTNPALANAVKFATAFAGVFVGGKLIGALGTLVSPLSGFVGILGKIPGLSFVSGILGNIGSAFGEVGLKLGKLSTLIAGSAGKKLIGGLGFIGKAFGSVVMEGIVPVISSAFPMISTLIGSLGSTIISTFSTMVGGLLAPLTSALAPLGSFIAGLFTPPAGWIMLALAGIGGMTAWINAEFKNGWSGFIDWAMDYISGTLSTMEGFLFDEFFGFVGSIGKMFGVVSSETAKKMQEGGVESNQNLLMNFLGLSNMGGMDMSGIGSSISNALSTLLETLVTSVFSGLSQVYNLMSFVTGWLQDTLTGIDFAGLGKTISTSWLDFLGNTLTFIFGSIHSAFMGSGGKGSMADSISNIWSTAVDILIDVGYILFEVTSGIVELFWGLFSGSFNKLVSLDWGSIFSNIWTKLGDVLMVTLDGLSYLVGEMTEWFTDLFYSGLEYFMNSPWSGWFGDIWDALKTAFWTTIDAYLSIGEWVYNTLYSGLKWAFSKVSSLGSTIGKYIKKMWEGAKQYISIGWTWFKDAGISALETTINTGISLLEGYYNTVLDIFHGIRTTVMSVWEHIKFGLKTAMIPIKQTFFGLVDVLKYKVFGPILQTLQDVLGSVIEAAPNWVLSTAGLDPSKWEKFAQGGMVESAMGEKAAQNLREGVSFSDIKEDRMKKARSKFGQFQMQKDINLKRIEQGKSMKVDLGEADFSGEKAEDKTSKELQKQTAKSSEQSEQANKEIAQNTSKMASHMSNLDKRQKKKDVQEKTGTDNTTDLTGFDEG